MSRKHRGKLTAPPALFPPRAVDPEGPAQPPDEIGPIWLPDPADLDLPPPTFTHNSGAEVAGHDDLRFISINVNGGMLAMPAPGLPTRLQHILHGASHTNTDFILLQDTRVTWQQAEYFEYLCAPWVVYQSPAPTSATGGCAILTRGHWARRDFGVAIFPDGRGIHIEVKGQGMLHLAILNLYCWPGSAEESPATRLLPTSAYSKNKVLFECCTDLLTPALARNRFLIAGGDLNMVLHAERDRANQCNDGDICAQNLLRDFTARLRIEPPSLDPLAADSVAWPATFHVGQPTATRLDYLMLPSAHVSASRGVATWSPRCIDTDHSAIMLTVCRSAALGKLTDASRRHIPRATRNITPFLTAKEAGPTWTEETGKLDYRYSRLTAILDEDLRPG